MAKQKAPSAQTLLEEFAPERTTVLQQWPQLGEAIETHLLGHPVMGPAILKRIELVKRHQAADAQLQESLSQAGQHHRRQQPGDRVLRLHGIAGGRPKPVEADPAITTAAVGLLVGVADPMSMLSLAGDDWTIAVAVVDEAQESR